MKGNKYKLKIVHSHTKNLFAQDGEIQSLEGKDHLDHDRIETVRRIKLESNFFNMFRTFNQ